MRVPASRPTPLWLAPATPDVEVQARRAKSKHFQTSYLFRRFSIKIEFRTSLLDTRRCVLLCSAVRASFGCPSLNNACQMIFVVEGRFMRWMPGGESGDIEDRRDEGGGCGFQ